MWWPIALIVFSNVFYNICSKQTPEGIHPLAALTVTYLVSAVGSGILFYILTPGGSLLGEYKKPELDYLCTGACSDRPGGREHVYV